MRILKKNQRKSNKRELIDIKTYHKAVATETM